MGIRYWSAAEGDWWTVYRIPELVRALRVTPNKTLYKAVTLVIVTARMASIRRSDG